MSSTAKYSTQFLQQSKDFYSSLVVNTVLRIMFVINDMTTVRFQIVDSTKILLDITVVKQLLR